jgi:hypothetical protein
MPTEAGIWRYRRSDRRGLSSPDTLICSFLWCCYPDRTGIVCSSIAESRALLGTGKTCSETQLNTAIPELKCWCRLGMITIQRGQSAVKIFVRIPAAKHTGAFWLVVVGGHSHGSRDDSPSRGLKMLQYQCLMSSNPLRIPVQHPPL